MSRHKLTIEFGVENARFCDIVVDMRSTGTAVSPEDAAALLQMVAIELVNCRQGEVVHLDTDEPHTIQ